MPNRGHAPRILLVALFGAALAPAALAWGLQRSGALAGSLLLNLEALFTVLLAAKIHREPLGARIGAAGLLMSAAGAALALRPHTAGSSTALGLVALAMATSFWALDNTLTRPLADLDPRVVVFWKALTGAILSFVLAVAHRDAWPERTGLVGLLACGATGYGYSLRLYLRAQRVLGAARTGSLFAVAPFFGAAIAVGLGDRSGAVFIAASAVLFAAAVWLQLGEAHRHRHMHQAVEHEHAHRHDDGHHTHAHDPPVVGEHSHRHRHESLEHDHPHGSDLHHSHEHD
jgi:drug/metabolite transporter (DMT)-like permease